MRAIHLFILFIWLCLSSRPGVAGGLPVDTYQLGNGLRVILHQDRRYPLVWVQVRYHVGAGHETPGRTGLAHLFEHLMFRGSRHLKDHFDYLYRVGAAAMNGSTSFDYTDYYDLMPAANLPVALWAEADRMGFLIDVFEAKRGDVVRDERKIVKNERRMRLETIPYRAAEEALWHSLFPAPHPYHGFVIGSMADLDAATMDELRAFCERHYSPANATLVLVGDFEPDQARAWIAKYFGTLRSGPRPQSPAVSPASLPGPVALTHHEKVGTQRMVMVAWHSPASYQPGDRAARVLAEVLTSNRLSRLRRRLAADGLSYHVSAEQRSAGRQSAFVIKARLAHQAEAGSIVPALDAVLAEIRDKGVTSAEVRGARERITSELLASLEDLSGKVDRLLEYQEYMGHPDRLLEDIHAYEAIGPEEVNRFARDVLRPDRRVLMYASPAGQGGAR